MSDSPNAERGMQAIRDALAFDALVRFMDENFGIWSAGLFLKDKSKVFTPRQWLERAIRHHYRPHHD